MSEPNIDNEPDFTPDTDIPNQCYRRPAIEISNAELKPALETETIIDAVELARLRANSERWEYAKQCAVDDDDDCFLVFPKTAFLDRNCDPDAEAFEAAVDAAIAAEKGAVNG